MNACHPGKQLLEKEKDPNWTRIVSPLNELKQMGATQIQVFNHCGLYYGWIPTPVRGYAGLFIPILN